MNLIYIKILSIGVLTSILIWLVFHFEAVNFSIQMLFPIFPILLKMKHTIIIKVTKPE